MTITRYYSAKGLLMAVAATFLVTAGCEEKAKPPTNKPFNYQDCVENIPDAVKGLEIITGPRSEKSIIRDMAKAVCRSRSLFEQMKTSGKDMQTGLVVLRIIVEYNGEVNRVEVEETTIQSEVFLRKVRDYVMNTDFIYWRVDDDDDTEFLYPIVFGG